MSLFVFFGFCAWLLFRKRIADFLIFKINRRLESFFITPFINSLLIVFILLYVKFDREQYYYGFNSTFFDDELPYHLKPQIDRYNTFTLMDEDGFELIGKGFRFYSNSFTINNLLAYGYNDTSMVVKCTDSLSVTKYLISYETKYKNKKGNLEISFKDLSKNDFEKIKEKYKWVDLDEEKVGRIRSYRTLSFVGMVLFLLLAILQIQTFPRKKNNYK